MLSYLRPLKTDLESLACPVNAGKMKSYLRGQFEYYGLKTPIRRSALKEFVAEYGKPAYSDIEKIVFDLFSRNEREFHYCAIDLCGMTEREWNEDSLSLFERMATTKSWWDTVDSVNSVCIRPFFIKFPELMSAETLRWANSDNIWLQRLSLIFQLRYKDKTNKRVLKRNIGLLKESDEFFVQKAIGWILRDLGHSDPEWVKSFVEKTKLQVLSRREALKHIG